MNLNRICGKCQQFFPVKPMELKFFCDKKECKEYFYDYHIYTLKRNRHIPMDYFDLYDLNRPTEHDYYGFERVCRICGRPLRDKKGRYNILKRYCNEHNGSELWRKYNWGYLSKNYAFDLQEKQKDQIIPILNTIPEELHNLVILCEKCEKPNLIHEPYYTRTFSIGIINIHHKIPVHTLNWENIHLIWDYSNLIALCPECHNSQDHQLKKTNQVQANCIQFLKITDFL